MAHQLTFNVMRVGAFPTVAEIASLPNDPNDVRVKEVEELFKQGELLNVDQRSEILNGIDLAFKAKLLKKGIVLPHFGTTNEDFVFAMSVYKAEVVNFLQKWQQRHDAAHGDTGLNLAGRAVYALRPARADLAPRPLWTLSFLFALDYLFAQIPSCIAEVSTYY